MCPYKREYPFSSIFRTADRTFASLSGGGGPGAGVGAVVGVPGIEVGPGGGNSVGVTGELVGIVPSPVCANVNDSECCGLTHIVTAESLSAQVDGELSSSLSDESHTPQDLGHLYLYLSVVHIPLSAALLQ
jgi:hypothetical protein